MSFVLATICVRKAFQSVFGDVSLGVFGLWIVWVLSVVIIGVCSEDRSQFVFICMQFVKMCMYLQW